MAIVKSYYRRSPGAASAAATGKTTSLRVVVYDGPASTTPVRFRGRQQMADLKFTTQLPGGFGSCSFTVTGAAARQWGIDTGHKVIVWNGRQVAWIGWIEDVQRGLNAVSVLALGPYEELRQRLVSDTYTAMTDRIVNDALDACTYVSSNRSWIEQSNVVLSDYTVTRAAVSSVIETMCDAGNDQEQRMLFAMWEPGSVIETPLGNDILYDGGNERPGDTASWLVYNALGPVYSGMWAAFLDAGQTSISHPSGTAYFDTKHLCQASQRYNLSIWLYAVGSGMGGRTLTVSLLWYSAASALLQTDSIDLTTAELPYNAWTNFSFNATSHASAYYVMVKVSLDEFISTDVYADEAILRPYLVIDKLSTPQFWALDLTDYDYTVRNAAIDFEETTNSLANYVLATYGASSVTAAAEDSASQTAYRRRDVVIAAGSNATQALAEAQRDAYLAAHSETETQLAGGDWSYQRMSTELLDKRGKPVDLARVRAGERIRIVDGEYAGSVVLIDKTTWNNGQLTITPERYADVAEILARSV